MAPSAINTTPPNEGANSVADMPTGEQGTANGTAEPVFSPKTTRVYTDAYTHGYTEGYIKRYENEGTRQVPIAIVGMSCRLPGMHLSSRLILRPPLIYKPF